MKQAGTLRQRLAALGGLGFLLLTFPLLGLPAGDLAGIPAVFLYLLLVWAGLIALAACMSEHPEQP